MMHLYHRDDCPFCWKVRLALHELGINASLTAVARGEKHPDVLQASPQGTVPVLIDNELALWESAIILDYLIDAFAGQDLLLDTPSARAQARQLQYYSDRIVGPALRDVIFEKRAAPRSEWNMARIAESTARWRACLDWLEPQVVQGGEGLLGRFSIADMALLPRFGLAGHYGVGVSWDHPRLAAWFAQASRRPSYTASEPVQPDL